MSRHAVQEMNMDKLPCARTVATALLYPVLPNGTPV